MFTEQLEAVHVADAPVHAPWSVWLGTEQVAAAYEHGATQRAAAPSTSSAPLAVHVVASVYKT